MNKIITNGVSSDTSTAYITTTNPPVNDNAVVRFDGTTGRYIQNSNWILDDAGNLSRLESGVQYSLLWQNRTQNLLAIGAEMPYSGLATFENLNDVVLVGDAAPNLSAGSNVIAIGSGSGTLFGNVSNAICIGNPGTALDTNTIRIGETQTRAFIAGIHGQTLLGSDIRMTVIDESGRLGTTTLPTTPPTFESTVETVAVLSPILFGTISVSLARVDKVVNCLISPRTYDFTGSPQNTISTIAGAIPAAYRPAITCLFPMIYRVNNVYDTGLVGSVIVSGGGQIQFVRDNDGAPSDFDGVSGWDYGISLSWQTA